MRYSIGVANGAAPAVQDLPGYGKPARWGRRFPTSAWDRLPAVLAFLLLSFQIALPWTVSHYVTMDGPSHVYSAAVMRDIVVHHRTSIYTPLYTIQHSLLVPNWTASILFILAGAVAGSDHAEQLVTSLLIVIGFLGISYAIRAISPRTSPWTPAANFLLQTWFLGMGFYNFYLGMILMPFLAGYYIRRSGRMNLKRAAVLSLMLLALFYAHLIAAALGIMMVIVLACWLNFVPPPHWSSARLRELGAVLGACVPTLIPLSMFASSSTEPAVFDPKIDWAWSEFPMHVFVTSGDRYGNQALIVHLVLFYLAAGVLLMRRKEWTSAHGALVISGLLTFLMYLLVPEMGFGGSIVKVRFSWGVFLIGILAVWSISRLRMLRVPVSLYIAGFLFMDLIGSARTARAMSNVAADYLSAAGQIRPKSSLVRVQYGAPNLPGQYGYPGSGRDPLFHLDALAAADRQCLDLSDYEALSKIFPLVYKDRIDRGQQYGLWGFEGADPRSVETLVWLQSNFPARIDYVLVMGDENSPQAVAQGIAKMLDYLKANMQLVSTSPNGFLRVYRSNR